MRGKKLVAVVGWRYEPEWLVNDFTTNIRPIVDELHIIDNRHQSGPWQDEAAYRRQQRIIAQSLGADWFLLTSPDERFEWDAAEKIRHAIEKGPQDQAYTLQLCEMWNMREYRVDGQFANRQRTRLFPMAAMLGDVPHRRIHSPVILPRYKRRRKPLDVRIYHLKNSVPENRRLRSDVMKKLDGEIGKDRTRSWDDFLAQDVVLERIPAERAFYPPYTRPFVWEPEEAMA